MVWSCTQTTYSKFGGSLILTINYKAVGYYGIGTNKLVHSCFIFISGEVDLFWFVASDKVIRFVCLRFLYESSFVGKHCIKRITFALVCWLW